MYEYYYSVAVSISLWSNDVRMSLALQHGGRGFQATAVGIIRRVSEPCSCWPVQWERTTRCILHTVSPVSCLSRVPRCNSSTACVGIVGICHVRSKMGKKTSTNRLNETLKLPINYTHRAKRRVRSAWSVLYLSTRLLRPCFFLLALTSASRRRSNSDTAYPIRNAQINSREF